MYANVQAHFCFIRNGLPGKTVGLFLDKSPFIKIATSLLVLTVVLRLQDTEEG